ncbi:MAG: hypothetical protein AB7K24_28390 [Gemmataceae bacterium]
MFHSRRFILVGIGMLASLVAGLSTIQVHGQDQQLQQAKGKTLGDDELSLVMLPFRRLGLTPAQMADVYKRLKSISLQGKTPEQRTVELNAHPSFKAILQDLRKQLDYRSLEDRLGFEHGTVKAGELNTEAIDKLKALESGVEVNANYRSAMLGTLHNDQVARFVSMEGLGRVRTVNPSFLVPREVVLPTLAKSSPLTPAEAGPPAALPSTADAAGGPQLMPARTELWNMHLSGEIDFLSSFGLIKERRVAAGFKPHAFNSVPYLHTQAAKKTDKEHWQVRQLELVSLLVHQQPAVYVSDKLPRMEELADAKVKTRQLADFETKALASLRNGDDLVTDATTNTIRMMGSIRATKQCLSCHSCERGALLGAFTYLLERNPPIR